MAEIEIVNVVVSASVGTDLDLQAISDTLEELESLKPSDDWIPIYLDRDVTSKLRKKWGLYIPEDLDEILRGI